MRRAVVAGVVLAAVTLVACSGGGTKFDASPACPILLQLSKTGQSVAAADVSDPVAFETTLQRAVVSYVRTAKLLRAAVPSRLRSEVDRMIAAAQQHRFSDGVGARTEIDDYARSVCATT